ncbi:hypothetical protein E1262_25575 [Jiangella aurantiaca]|uniref:Uncharacterized protein n=1 Tax=Jiangella aurantiaca TaxID=2530373 RepID=A0A4R5A0Q4_9ACTN|nr:hypothetical protein [Jiangella aurantiaca]TDD65343.1 hypothetical protein E1262_25575 [Jiangella aurantiaca]
MAADASDLRDDTLWLGGAYELAVELGERDDVRLEAALTTLWAVADVAGCHAADRDDTGTWTEAPLTAVALQRHGRLAGLVTLPRRRTVVCGVRAVRQVSGTDWLVFFIPVGALDLAEPRSAAFPFRGGDSLLWRRPLDRWLAGIGARVYEAVPFRLALIGPEVAGLTTARSLGGQPPVERWAAYLIPSDAGLEYHPADR